MKKILLLLLLITLQLSSFAQTRQADSLALVMLFDSTNGPTWTNPWHFANPIDSFYGVTVTNNRVTHIDLSNNSLSGNVPDINLTNLIEFDFSFNQLLGGFPNFSQLPALQKLWAKENYYSGNIPNFSALPNLTDLNLSNNELSGNIPNFSNLANLQELDLSANELSGSIPDFTNLPNLQVLNVTQNTLTGGLPNFTSLPNLQYFDASFNPLGGSLPNFTALPNVQTLYLFDCQLMGSIPNFSSLPNLQKLYLNNNNLSGNIPAFNNLSNLQELDLNNNECSGSIPSFSNLINLRWLNLRQNLLTGTIPNLSLPNLASLFLNQNTLTGGVPDFNGTALETINLSNNKLDSTLTDLSGLNNLSQLFLNDNRFTFEDFLPAYTAIAPLFSNANNFRYNTQDSVGEAATATVQAGINYTIDVAVDDTVSTNVYYWYQDGQLVDSTFGVSAYTINNFQAADTGTYTVVVTNSSITNPSNQYQNLQLYGRPITLQIATSIKHRFFDQSIRIQPQPVITRTNLSLENGQGAYILELYNLQGQQLWQKSGFYTAPIPIHLANYPKGMYVVRLTNNDTVWTQKILKQ